MSSSLPSPQMAEMEALIEIKPEFQTCCTNHMRMHLANDPSCLSTLATTVMPKLVVMPCLLKRLKILAIFLAMAYLAEKMSPILNLMSASQES